MTPVTLVYAYYQNGGMLEQQCRAWSGYSATAKAQIAVVVVDDGSPTVPASAHLTDCGLSVTLYRIHENLVWNVAGARNLGMQQAADGWCLLTDIDHVLMPEDADRLVSTTLNAKCYYTPARKWANGKKLDPHSNTYLLQRDLYWKTGGSDEDYTGWWGAGEPAFRKMIRMLAKGHNLPSVTLTHFGRDDIADASTTEWGRKDSPYYWSHNPALLKKWKAGAYKASHPIRFTWERVS